MKSRAIALRDGPVCAGLFVLAATTRLLFLSGTVDRALPFSIFYYGDSRLYREFALAILRGAPFDGGIPFHPPAFAYVLAVVIAGVGERPFALRLVLALLGASVVPFVYLLGRALWGRAVGVTASLLASFSFGLLVAAVSANTETIYIPLLTLQLLLVVRLGDSLVDAGRVTRRVAFVAAANGGVLGVASLTRAEHLALAVLLGVALLLGWGWSAGRARIAGVWGIALAVAALVLAPWTIHNYRELSRFNEAHAGLEPLPTFVLVSSYGPLNFALANHEGADGTFQPGSLAGSMGAGRLELADPKQGAIYREGYRLGFQFIRDQPRAAARLALWKLQLATDALALGFGISNLPGGTAGMRRPVDLFVPRSKIWKIPALLLALLGLYVSRAHWRRLSVLWLAVLNAALVSVAFFGYARFFVHATPVLLLFVGAALVALAARLPRPLRRGLAWLGAALAVALLLELAVAAAHPRNFRASGSVDPATGKIVQDAAVEIEPAR